MPRYKLIAMTDHAEGREADYHAWYGAHLREVLALPGFRSAQRFRLAKALGAEGPFSFVAIYEVETDDIDGAMAELIARATSGRLSSSDAVAPKNYAAVYEELGPSILSEAASS
jgi:hypothetical protein